MDLQRTGAFLQKLRKEKNITQEQLAEQFGTSRRTVSRWETGNNLPDIDILMELADFYEIDLREILDGKRRSEQMKSEVKDTVLRAAEYDNEKKTRQEMPKWLAYYLSWELWALSLTRCCIMSIWK